ncbi:carbon-nitrogen hydrolase [Dactylosporangium fulvum]|uniref:Carbon-nitrogen hydrolase family protein n=1 Tax=Dactylosporangium fulvum TaxID=53359 RepID=A0ABY5WBB8_9ACTN|nr:carbon-nitrogen hydrolase family protein [Dactylosporangium fulvum]UWP86571.1 carbon-nitrogen hydrolase family protein [Dactylosporangium fulvum]
MTDTVLAVANMKVTRNKTANLRRILELVDEAAAQDADVLVLPEMCLQGFADFSFGLGDERMVAQKRYYFHESEPIPGPSTQAVQERAARHGMVVQFGLAEKALHGNLVFNSTAIVGPDGVIGSYRKVHNPAEAVYFGPGERTPVFDLGFATGASMICYDLAFPELARVFALQGATVLLMSTAWPMRGSDRSNDYHGISMDLAAKANAFFNQSWLLVSNQCQTEGDLHYWGHSQIVDPFGIVVAELADEEGVVTWSADLGEEILRARTEGFFGLNLLQDRRPQHYGLISDPREYRAST